LFCYDTNLVRKEIPVPFAEVRALLAERNGTVWIGTTGQGLALYRHGDYSFLRKTNGLASDYVRSLAQDREGSLWVGTREGLSQLTDVKFTTQPASENTGQQDALAVGASRKGGIWVGSSGGLTYFDGKPKTYGVEAGLSNLYTKRVFEASNGDVYLVSGVKNLVIFADGKVVTNYEATNMVAGMAEDAQGVVVSVGGSLYRAGRDYFRPYPFTNGDPKLEWVLNLAAGREGEILVACDTGVFRVKDGGYRQWGAAEGLSDPRAQWVCEDREGVIWGATLNGMFRLKDNQVLFMTRKDGLFDNNIYSIEPDDFGNLWVDSGRGIFEVSRKNINDFAEGKASRIECMVYDGPESVKPSDKSSQEHVACKTLDGRIWFPSANGVVEIDPAHILSNRIAPPVQIDSVRANGVEMMRSNSLVVPPGAGELEIHFSALSFIAPHKVSLRYRLEGYDKSWVEIKDRHAAFYTNLKPGRYKFRVIAANADGVWNERGDAIGIELRPHYYQTAWFEALCGGLGCAALLGLYAWRVRQLQQKRRDLQRRRELLESEVLSRTTELATANQSLQAEIGERTRAEQELKGKTALLEAQMNSSPDGILVVDPQGKKILQNQRTADLLKMPQHIQDCEDAETQRRWVAGMSKNPEQFTAKIAHLYSHPKEISRDEAEFKDGTTLDQYSAPVVGKDGKYYGRIWTLRDITERKRTEERLRLQSTALEAVANAVVITDHNGMIQSVNPAFTALTGYTAEEAAGKNPRILKSGSQDEAFYRNLWQTISSGQVWSGELTNRRKDGSLYNEEMTITPLRDADGVIARYIAIKQDITGRKEAEEALRESKQILEGIINAIPVRVFWKDKNLVYLGCNAVFARDAGYADPKDLIGKDDYQMGWRDQAEKYRRDDREVIESGRAKLLIDEPQTTPEGNTITLLSNKLPLRNSTGEISGVLGTYMDITERKRTEVALQERAKLAALEADVGTALTRGGTLAEMLRRCGEAIVRQLDVAFARFWTFNARENMLELQASAGMYTHLNGPHGRVPVGKFKIGLIAEERKPHLTNQVVGDPRVGDQEWAQREGMVAFAGYPLLIEDRLVGVVAMFARHTLTDTTLEALASISNNIAVGIERKWAEEELRASKKRFQDLFDSSRDAIMTTEPPSWKFTSGNPAAVKMFGAKSMEDFIAHSPWELSPDRQPDGRASAEKGREMIEKAMREGSHFFEWTHRRIGGEEFPATVLISRVQSAGKVFSLATVRDITESKRLEAHLFQSQKMETVGKLAGGIAHEFNSIMTAIIGQSELLLNDLPARNPLLKNAREIRQAAERAAILTRQLLAYGRKQMLQPEVLDLNAILAGMETMLRHLVGKNADVSIVPAAGLRAVKVDAGQIEQVIVNIVMNAADAMPNGGKLMLETANVTLGPDYVSGFPGLKAGEYVMLAITDTGIGMKEEDKARVFEPFFSTKEVGQGTGLGLATCYGIVKQSGGHISVYSEAARGATFKIYLPQVEPLPKIPGPRLDSPDLPGGTETILLAEDDPALREMAATLLRRLGYTVLTAANGLEALNLKQQRGTGHIDLLFTDVVMPSMGGKELSDRIRAMFPHTRILFTSAYTQGAMMHQGVLDPGVALLQKPFTPSALARKVREALDAEDAAQPKQAPVAAR
jgi:PAS domain S-box-containing protein